VPFDEDHVTAALVLPVTVAVNCCVAPVCTAAEGGTIATEIVVGAAMTVTVAEPETLESATLVAMTE